MFRPYQHSTFLSFVQRHRYWLTWLTVYVSFVLLGYRHTPLTASLFIASASILPMIVLSETLRYLFIPRLLHRNRFAYYTMGILTVAFLAICALQIEIVLYRWMPDHFDYEVPNYIRHDLDDSREGHILLHLKYTFLLLTTMAIVTISRLLDERQDLERTMQENQLRNEIRLIRAQINPHFLFNALNCIYALAITRDDQTPDSVLRLSEMLRYVVDDCRAEAVALQKEVQYIRNYIAFQQIRMEQRGDISFDVTVSNPEAPVPPMLFQPIVENCFKHSDIAHIAQAFVHITLRQEADGTLLLETRNSISPHVGHDHERQGIGLQNVKQHLDLLFGPDASLSQQSDGETFITQLRIGHAPGARTEDATSARRHLAPRT